MQEFFNMGGYGQFIWPCYAMSALVLIGLLVASIRDSKKARRELDLMERLDENQKTGAGPMAQPQPGE